MLRGIYSSAAGMIMEMEKVSMHAHNISNAQSAGYKKREMAAIPFKEIMINMIGNKGDKREDGQLVGALQVPVGTGAGASSMYLESTQGSLKPTGSALDVAIEGNGYFTFRVGLKVPQSPVQNEYTSRNGRLLLNNDGDIINAEGHFLVDDKGNNIRLPIIKGLTEEEKKLGKKLPQIQPGDDIAKEIQKRLKIDENGRVFDGKNPTPIALLKVQTDTDQVKRLPELNLIVHEQMVARRDAKGALLSNENMYMQHQQEFTLNKMKPIVVKQGFIEGSNVQIITEMIGLIHASKNYESSHKLIMSEDKILDKAINELGRTG